MAEGGTLLRCYVEQSASRVQIPITPFFSRDSTLSANYNLRQTPKFGRLSVSKFYFETKPKTSFVKIHSKSQNDI